MYETAIHNSVQPHHADCSYQSKVDYRLAQTGVRCWPTKNPGSSGCSKHDSSRLAFGLSLQWRWGTNVIYFLLFYLERELLKQVVDKFSLFFMRTNTISDSMLHLMPVWMGLKRIYCPFSCIKNKCFPISLLSTSFLYLLIFCLFLALLLSLLIQFVSVNL